MNNERDCQHGRQIGKCAECDVIELEAECERLRRQKSARQALSIQLIDEARALRAELEAIKGQEPVAIANKGDCAFWVSWTEAGKPLRGHGIKLYALPPAKADEVSVPRDFLTQIIAEWEHDNDKYGLARELRSLLASGKEQP